MKSFILFLLPLLIFSCNNDVDIIHPVIDTQGLLDETEPLEGQSKLTMNGLYTADAGGLFGNTAVVKWNGENLSIFSGNEGAYAVLRGGSLDSILYFEGHWRFPFSTATGLIRIVIPADSGGSAVLSGDTSGLAITAECTYGSGNEIPSSELILRYAKPLPVFSDDEQFEILAHRGGGRNSDYLGPSENTVQIMSLAGGLGATGVELDVRMSSDGVLFLYHDDDINLRLTQKGPLWGRIENYSWAQLRTLITLSNGEKIPSLEEALNYIIDSTTLRTIWLDLKNPNGVDQAAELQKQMLERAGTTGRNVKIYLGLPEEEIVSRFKELNSFQLIPSLCELGIPVVRELNSLVWAPRWTDGLQLDAVREMRGEDRQVFVWTVDQPAFVKTFIREGEFNGILTNYPPLVAYYHYTRFEED